MSRGGAGVLRGGERLEALARVRALEAEGMSRKDACKQVARETGLSKNALYALAVK